MASWPVTSASLSALAGWRIERRAVPGSALRYRVVAIVLGVLLSIAIGIILSEGSTSDFLGDLWRGSFGSAQGFGTLTRLAFPLILLGLAVSIAFRLGLWNIGGEGQLFVGAWAASGIAFLLAGLPYKLVGAQRFYGRREVKDVIAYLRLVHNPNDEFSLLRVINTPGRGIGNKTVLALRLAALIDGAESLALLGLVSDEKAQAIVRGGIEMELRGAQAVHGYRRGHETSA